MEETKERLLQAIEQVHNAQANLLENVSPPEDKAQARGHLDKAVGMLVEAVRILSPMCGSDLRTPSGYLFIIAFRKME